jgi:hypothetical protein
MTKTLSGDRRAKPDDKDQSRRFMDAAREIGADENTSVADELIGRLAKQPREPKAKNSK